MKRLNFIAFAIAVLAIVLILLPWIHRSNSEYYVYGYSLGAGKLGLVSIIFSTILFVSQKFKAAILIMALDVINSFGFVIGWIQRADSDGANNVFEGLQLSLFLYLISILTFIIIIWKMKLKSQPKERSNS